MPWSFVFSDGNKKKSQGARLELQGGNLKFGQKLHDNSRREAVRYHDEASIQPDELVAISLQCASAI